MVFGRWSVILKSNKMYILSQGLIICRTLNCLLQKTIIVCAIQWMDKNMINKIIKIFHANSLKHLVIIFTVFAITGSLSVYVTEPIINFINLKKLVGFYPVYLIIKVVIVLICYNILLITLGTLAGQFSYFFNMQKKFLRRFGIKI